ncbi:MAG: glycosyltransferase [Chloroflexi bacterium]|nr:glycosyltransferase [Chloroflexota bacterium]
MKTERPIRVLSLPDIHGTNTYLRIWYEAAGVEPVLPIPHRLAEYQRTICNPQWLRAHRDDFDVLHVQWLYAQLPFVAFCRALFTVRALGKRIVWTVHEVLPHDGENVAKHRAIGTLLARLADRVVVHTAYAQAEYRRLFPARNNVHLIGLPDYEVELTPQAAAKARLNEDRFIFLFFGHIKRYKGLDLLLSAFDPKALDAALYVVGEFGQGADDPVRVAQDEVVLRTGECSESDLDLYLSAADAIVLPYRRCYTSAALQRAEQHGKALVLSREVARTMTGMHHHAQVFDGPDHIAAALLAARQGPGGPGPRSFRNIEDALYRAELAALYV